MLNIIQTIKEKILDIPQTVERNVSILTKLLPVLSFMPPLLILYSLHSWSFEQTYHGRTFLLFFIWLVSLEIILSWEKLQKNKVNRLGSIRTVLFILALLLPTIYVIAANYCGLNAVIEDLAKQKISPGDPLKDQHASLIPLSTEYLVFAVLFCLIILLAYGINGLIDFPISTFFLGIIGVLFTIDNLYPYGKLTPLQIFVPTTATLAANVLNLMGYETRMSFISNDPIYGSMPSLQVKDFQGFWHKPLGIAWPCAGVESLLIYTVTILLFFKKTDIPWKHKIIYFAIGAVVTYFINVLRVVTLFVIATNTGGVHSVQFQRFHNYYGMLYSIAWIMSYPLIIIGSQALWGKIRNWKTSRKGGAKFSTRTKLSE
ncbi:MAG: archaeosortase/exosortase family protein [Candidatus Bathyarchaeota archaeon]|nr:archaeosortase/exosortase family protein [Candidatus Bathyarchaeota archaeon]